MQQRLKHITIGAYSIGQRNDRGDRLAAWATEKDYVLCNTIFKQHPRRLWTWKSPGDNTRNQIDYVLIKTRFRNAIKSCKTYPGADCYSDHVPIVSVVHLKLRKLKRARAEPKLNLGLLKTDKDLKRGEHIWLIDKTPLIVLDDNGLGFNLSKPPTVGEVYLQLRAYHNYLQINI